MFLVGVEDGAERLLVEDILGALIYERTLLARIRSRLGIRFNEILAYLGANGLHLVAKMRHYRVVAADRVPRLHDIPGTQRRQRSEYHQWNQPPETEQQADQGNNGECDAAAIHAVTTWWQIVRPATIRWFSVHATSLRVM